jgi:hypothetical protein
MRENLDKDIGLQELADLGLPESVLYLPHIPDRDRMHTARMAYQAPHA